MMKDITHLFAAALVGIAAVGSVPSRALLVALVLSEGASPAEVGAVVMALTAVGYATQDSNNVLTITALGKAKVAELDAAIARQEAHTSDTATQFPAQVN